jgi:hypothetical protein
MHIYNPSTQNPEVGGSRVGGKLGLQKEFKVNLSIMLTP